MIDSHFKLSLPEVLSEAGYYNFYKTTPVFSDPQAQESGPAWRRPKVNSLIVPPELPIIQTTPAPELVPAASDAPRHHRLPEQPVIAGRAIANRKESEKQI
jgi:hypothetical protein